MANVLASKILDVEIVREVLSHDVEEGAKLLLGCILVKGSIRAQIVETEAYTWDDPGCHSFGKTKMKNMAMFGEPGTAYIYFTYGNHWMLNVVAHPAGTPSAVLIRAAKPVQGIEEIRANRPQVKKENDLLAGPGRLAKGYDIDSRFNGIDLFDQDQQLSIIKSETEIQVGASARIGLATGKGENLIRRFVDLNNLTFITRHPLNRTFLRDICHD